MKQTTQQVHSVVGVIITSMTLGIGILSYNLIDMSHQLKEKSHALTHVTKEKENIITKYQVEVESLHKEITNLETTNSVLYNEIKDYQSRPTYMIENFEITAYTAGYESTQKHKGDPAYGITTSGTKVQEGKTVACPPNIPLGTKVDISTIGIRVCEDRGEAIKQNKLDLYMDKLEDAINFGRKTLPVVIMNGGSKQ